MAEAEDVILDVVERATRAVRDRGAPDPGAGTELRRVRRRLALFAQAVLGREWTIVAVDDPPRPTWLRRLLDRPAPWVLAARARPSTDGAQLFLPRRVDTGEGPDADLALLRVMALGQGARARRLGPGLPDAATPLARDLLWLGQACALEAALVAELPGLARDLAVARRLARRDRPADDALGATEQAAEGWVRRLLGAPPDRPPPDLPALDAPRAAWRAWADGLAAALDRGDRHRGIAPVPAWGVPRAALVAAPGASSPSTQTQPASRRSHALPRRLEAADPDRPDDRPGPFMAYGEPQLGVQAPAGLSRPRDHGEEEDLAALADELAGLEAAPRVRAEGEVPDALPGEDERRATSAVERTASAADDGAVFRYPEWDRAALRYRPAFVHVREAPAARGDPAWVARVLAERRATLAALRRRFEALRARRARRPRQADGDELDLEAWVSLVADRRARVPADDRLYVASPPGRRDVAVALLVDASGSTDGHAAQGRRVIDVAREAVLCFCEALGATRDRHAVWAFTGRGPRDVRLLRVKGWSEPLGPAVRERIAGLAPGDFTRLGAAIRHATAGLAAQPARHRLLVVVTDGRPNDEDEYAGEHGIDDVRQALAEARLIGLRPFALTIDPAGGEWLPRMLGPRDHAVLLDPASLPERLTDLVRRLTS